MIKKLLTYTFLSVTMFGNKGSYNNNNHTNDVLAQAAVRLSL